MWGAWPACHLPLLIWASASRIRCLLVAASGSKPRRAASAVPPPPVGPCGADDTAGQPWGSAEDSPEDPFGGFSGGPSGQPFKGLSTGLSGSQVGRSAATLPCFSLGSSNGDVATPERGLLSPSPTTGSCFLGQPPSATYLESLLSKVVEVGLLESSGMVFSLFPGLPSLFAPWGSCPLPCAPRGQGTC